MSQVLINDGTGSGNSAQVDSKNRLRIRGLVDNPVTGAVDDGRAFVIGTGLVNLTSADHSHILYIKNTGAADLHVDITSFQFGVSTGGSGDYQSTFTSNPTGGTLISGGAAGVAVNVNGASANTLSATVLVGSEGSTISGGAGITDLFVQGRTSLALETRIPKGKSISFSMKAPPGNTSCDVALSVRVYEVDATDTE